MTDCNVRRTGGQKVVRGQEVEAAHAAAMACQPVLPGAASVGAHLHHFLPVEALPSIVVPHWAPALREMLAPDPGSVARVQLRCVCQTALGEESRCVVVMKTKRFESGC